MIEPCRPRCGCSCCPSRSTTRILFEQKWDGFRALAIVDDGNCRLMSRNGHPFAQWETLKRDSAATLRGYSATLDGELVCLAPDGRARFHRLMFRRDGPFYMAFELLELDGEASASCRSSNVSDGCAV